MLLNRPDLVVRNAAVHWANARAALSIALQARDRGDHATATRAMAAARACGQLAAFYRRRLVVLLGTDHAAIANQLHRSGVIRAIDWNIPTPTPVMVEQ